MFNIVNSKNLSLDGVVEIFRFNIYDSGANLYEYNGSDKVLDIPGFYKGIPVDTISGLCFYSNDNVVEINLPPSITTIYYRTFAYCRNLKKIILNEGITNLMEDCFSNCHSLENITFPASLEVVGDWAFSDNTSLTSVTFLSENTKISKNTFYNCNALVEIDFCYWKFLSATQLLNIVSYNHSNWNTISEDKQKQIVTFIKRRANLKKDIFLSNNCALISFLISLKVNINLEDLNVYLQHSIDKKYTDVTAVFLDYKDKNFSKSEIDTFEENRDLVEIGLENPTLKQIKAKWNFGKADNGYRITGYKGENINETIPAIIDDGKGGSIEITRLAYVNGKDFEPIENLTILAKIRVIDDKTFEGNTTLRSITLPDSLKFINYQSFYHCEKLEKIHFPDSVMFLGSYTFVSCKQLEEVIFSAGMVEIAHWAFAHCIALKNVVFSDGIRSITNGSFYNCVSLTEINIPKNVTQIEANAFSGCVNLQKVYLPKGIAIADDAFGDCVNVEFIYS